MNLAVSNIAWGAEDLGSFLSLLGELGCAGVELAPSLVWDEPADADAVQRAELRRAVEAHGLEVAGLHALLYTRRDLTLFATPEQRDATVEYLSQLCRLCADLGGRVLVFGSPAARVRGTLARDAALEIAATAFRTVAEAAYEAGVAFLIEPLRPDQTDFVASTAEGLELVERVAHPGFALHLDAAAVLAEALEPSAIVGVATPALRHVHASAPGLLPPYAAGPDHAPFGAALRAVGYDGYVSLEMRRPQNRPEQIERSIAYLRRCYLAP